MDKKYIYICGKCHKELGSFESQYEGWLCLINLKQSQSSLAWQNLNLAICEVK